MLGAMDPAGTTLLLAGDVMLGRGVDQVLGHPGDPALAESWVRDAREYVALAEAVSGPVPAPVDDTWPWGDALGDLADPAGVRILNLETAVTRCDDLAPGKAVHYRMSPANLGSLVVARPDVCVLANNHVLDHGRDGLAETLDVLHGAGLTTVGAGHDLSAAEAPAVVDAPGDGRVVVLAWADTSAGVPWSWTAGSDRSGVALLPDLSPQTAALVGARVQEAKRPGSIVVVSLHWGSNWGYAVPGEQVRFARAVVDAGADVVHGHSSHHPRPIEVHAGRLVLYGCGDLVNDYEGISGHEAFRSDLRLLPRARLAADGALLGLDLLPYRARRLRLERAGSEDVAWLGSALGHACRRHGSGVRRVDGHLALTW
jgi:poly-gamma-glutamate synthesis protein (capsule biosynthesis protein)